MRPLTALLLTLGVVAPSPAAPPAPMPVLFDTDMDSDCDDLGALAALHALADRGEATVLATVASSKHEWTPACIDAINTYYGRPDVPIGQPKGAGTQKPSRYARPLAERFPNDVGRGEKVPDAMAVYRRVLAAQPDDSVVLVTVGYLTNVADLLRLPVAGDQPSGMDLVRRKVKRWVCMGGNFVGRPAVDDLKLGNNNFTYDKAAAHYAVTNWPKPLTFVGREVGSVPSGLKVGANLKRLPEANPVRAGYALWFGGEPKDRHVADQTTVLFAVRGPGEFWDVESKGHMDLALDMTFRWKFDRDPGHAYVLKRTVDGRPTDRAVERAIEDLMLQPPHPTPAKGNAQATPKALAREAASTFARLALKGVMREYPNKPGNVIAGPGEVKSPKALHPAFYGSYDWHSAVHGHWLLVKVLRTHPAVPEARDIRRVLDAHLAVDNVRAEVAYFDRPEEKSFERPYGWAWLLKLAEELHAWDDPDANRWSANLRPLAELIAARYVTYFPKQTYPIRTGVHANTAFGLGFAHDYAVALGDAKLRAVVEERAKTYFGKDVDYPAGWEPGGADFLSPAVCEADLMRRVLPPAEFRAWFARFLPGAPKGEPKALFAPATVTDRTDPQLVHLDGLNLSRAWGLRAVVTALPQGNPTRAALSAAADRHAAAALPHVASGDYAGEHWLASFAVYLLATPAPE